MTDLAIQRLKVTVVGDGNVGKTCLLYAFKNGRFPPNDQYVVNCYDDLWVDMEHEGDQVQLNLWDTAGQEAYERLRLLIYPRTDVFLLCYAVNSTVSFDNIADVWLPEVKKQCPSATIILVATKLDTRSCTSQAVNAEQGWRLCKSLKLQGFQECSSKTGQGVREAFDTAVEVALLDRKRIRAERHISCWQTRCVLM